MRTRLTCLFALLVCAARAAGQETPAEPFVPRVEPASDEARKAMAGFKVAPGFTVELFAAEPMLANPVCFYFDHNGRDVYVGETFRHHKGVTDIRDHMDWNDDDLAARTVEDRVAYFKKHLGDKFPEFERACERVRLIRDTDGDGVADQATVFADRFRGAADGIGASLLSYKGDVYYTCIPSVWLLRDDDGDGAAEMQRELSTGYGVHVALLGHDLHGLRIGPDRKLYFSIGDRGFNVPVPGGRIEHPETGAVLRCNLDGTELEVFALGLRNPQDLIFDAYGNLFTGDNNSDGGDKARIVHVVEGSDSGWRQAFQWINEPDVRGPWNDEKLWIPHFDGQAAYIVPPIENLGDGPSGLTINPGTGFPASYDGAFFLCDFRGSASTSGVRSFKLTPRGAGFELDSPEEFWWGSLVTDCDIAPDGALYILDWVEGWNQTGKGRIYRAFDPASRDAAPAREARKLLAEGFDKRGVTELAALLAHADQRVRQEAQFALAARGTSGLETLEQVSQSSVVQLARIHAIWGLGIALRRHGTPGVERLFPLLNAKDPEIRAQVARVLGDLREKTAASLLTAHLHDASPRVRLYAAIGVGRIGTPMAVEDLFQLARDAGESDPVLRHAAIFGLASCASIEELVAATADESADARIAAVVALRRRGAAEVAQFLADGESRVQLEAARAIYDTPIPAAMHGLTRLIERKDLTSYPLLRRVINANFRLGKPASTRALASFALRGDVVDKLRLEALQRLAQWEAPSARDPVVGEWRPIERRDVSEMSELTSALGRDGIGSGPPEVVRAWIRMCEVYRVTAACEMLLGWAADRERPGSVRARAIEALVELEAPGLRDALNSALVDPDGEVRAAAISAATRISPAEALGLCEAVLRQGETRERRTALRALGKIADPGASALLATELDKHAASLFPAELALDLVLACEERKDPALDAKLEALRAARASDPVLQDYLDSLNGGEVAEGRKLFREKAEIACLRCHKIEEGEGGEVGPDLRAISQRVTGLALLESICAPNRQIAMGFESTLVFLKDETRYDGRIVFEDETTVRLLDAQGVLHEVPVAGIQSRRAGLSAMPEGAAEHLSREEMRNLIAYLSQL